MVLNKKIKIFYVIGRLNYGGAERLLLDICRKIDKDLFDVKLISIGVGGKLKEKFIETGIEVIEVEKSHKFSLAVIKKITQIFESEKPDIVHTHLFTGDFYGGVAALNAKVPVVISTKHDILKESFWRDLLSRKIHKRLTKIIAISQAVRDFLIDYEKLSNDKIQIIYNGIDVSKFYTPSTIFKSDKIVIGSIGRLSKEKGYKHLIRSLPFLKHKNWEVLLVGDGPLKKDLQRQVMLLGLEEKVQFIGEVADVRPYLERMDIFVMPSVSEGLCLALIEAALAGKFVIATKIGGIPEIIRDQETGLLFRPKNIEQLVNLINWVIDHQHDARRMVVELQKEVLEKFDINKMIFQYQKMYQDLVKGI